MTTKEYMKRFILIDGNAIVHRAYHGLPPLTSPDGTLVNAVYGFFSMVLKILQEYKPDYLVVCFDRPTPTFRKQLYVGYQAKRPAVAEGLGPQFDFIRETLQKAHVPIEELDGYEADDLIGTLARQVVESCELKDESEKIEVVIFSGDRDLLQLVNSHVKMLAPVTGISNMILFDEKSVEEKYGLKPRQFIDYKALVGDNSDNYPGVNGIGPKTASDLLEKYDTFENLYEHISELPEKTALKLATDAEQAALAKKLATIITDAPIHLDQQAARVSSFDLKSLEQSFELFGFNSLIRRLHEDDEKIAKKKTKSNQLGLL